jgi:hypothetical protein
MTTAELQLEDWQNFLLRADRRFHELLLESRSEHPELVSDELLRISDQVYQI